MDLQRRARWVLTVLTFLLTVAETAIVGLNRRPGLPAKGECIGEFGCLPGIFGRGELIKLDGCEASLGLIPEDR